MDDYQRPEGRLLRQALEASRLSTRQAAKDMGISDARLRQIINGYQPVGRGQKIEVVAPTATLARAAFVLNVSPNELREAGREDAAADLEEQLTFGISADISTRSTASIAELQEYLEHGDLLMQRPPIAAMYIFSDEQLVDELKRRLADRAKQVRDYSGVTAIIERGKRRDLPSVAEEQKRRRERMSEMGQKAARTEDEK